MPKTTPPGGPVGPASAAGAAGSAGPSPMTLAQAKQAELTFKVYSRTAHLELDTFIKGVGWVALGFASFTAWWLNDPVTIASRETLYTAAAAMDAEGNDDEALALGPVITPTVLKAIRKTVRFGGDPWMAVANPPQGPKPAQYNLTVDFPKGSNLVSLFKTQCSSYGANHKSVVRETIIAITAAARAGVSPSQTIAGIAAITAAVLTGAHIDDIMANIAATPPRQNHSGTTNPAPTGPAPAGAGPVAPTQQEA